MLNIQKNKIETGKSRILLSQKIFLAAVFAITLMMHKLNAQSWSITGNAGTTSSNFVGTTDGNDLRFKTSNSTRMTINSSGYAGIAVTPESYSRLYTYFSVPSIISQDQVRAAMRSRVYGSSATRANGYLGAHYSSSGSSTNLPVGLTYMGVLGIKEDADDNGAGVVGWNKSNATTGFNYGVFGLANGIAGIGSVDDRNVGVYGSASGNLGNIGVYGNAEGSGNWGGYFKGRGYFSDKLGINEDNPTSMLTVNAPTATAIMSLRLNGLTKMYLNSSGYLGIGTTSQTSVLEVNAPASTSPFKLAINGSTKMLLNSSGSLGIGTTSTTIDAKLRVDHTGITQAVFGTAGTGVSLLSSYPGIAFNSYYTNVFKTIQAGYGADISCDPTTGNLWFRTHANGASANATVSYTTRMTVQNDGRVVIGSIAPATGYKLSVDGKVICEELKVQTSGSWPDYVFADNYDLPSLSEIENHIKANKHLPGIPSAKEAEAEGIEVGQMQKKLLEKIEELTLYVIDLGKKVKSLESK